MNQKRESQKANVHHASNETRWPKTCLLSIKDNKNVFIVYQVESGQKKCLLQSNSIQSRKTRLLSIKWHFFAKSCLSSIKWHKVKINTFTIQQTTRSKKQLACYPSNDTNSTKHVYWESNSIQWRKACLQRR